jgi:hypothetical protein
MKAVCPAERNAQMAAWIHLAGGRRGHRGRPVIAGFSPDGARRQIF